MKRHFLGLVGGAELIAILILAAALLVPLRVTDAASVSLFTQLMIAIMGALSVYIMLRMDLMSFSVPAFMAVGGYSAAILGVRHGITDLATLTVVAFGLPFLLAIPLGLLILRMRGVYFVLVTFVIAEIMPLLLFETPEFTGGPNGISDLPPVTLFGGYSIGDNNSVLMMVTVLAMISVLLTVVITRAFRSEFDAIRENELLAQSLGLVVAKYKILGFCFAAGIAGMGGFALAEMLMTANPASFSAMSSVDYVAYVIVGGANTILGPIAGAAVLVWASNIFSMKGEISQGLFGLVLILAVILAKGGLAGIIHAQYLRLCLRSRKPGANGKGESS